MLRAVLEGEVCAQRRRGRRSTEWIDTVSECMGGMEGEEEEQNGLTMCQNGWEGWKERKKKNRMD